jgi:hypothetical protein
MLAVPTAELSIVLDLANARKTHLYAGARLAYDPSQPRTKTGFQSGIGADPGEVVVSDVRNHFFRVHN